MGVFTNFIRDFGDRSATPRRTPNWVEEGLTVAGVGIAGASSYLEFTEKIVKPIFGDWTGFFQFLLILGAILWSGSIIRAKSKGPSSALSGPRTIQNLEYEHSQPIRNIAKLLLILLTFTIPSKAKSVYFNVTPLPTELYGILKDPLGRPVIGGTILVKTPANDSITASTAGPDSDGLYHVVATRRIRRSDKLEYIRGSCSGILRLDRAHQIAPLRDTVTGKMLSPAFNDIVDCKEH